MCQTLNKRLFLGAPVLHRAYNLVIIHWFLHPDISVHILLTSGRVIQLSKSRVHLNKLLGERRQYLSAGEGGNVDHVDVDHQVQALRLHSPVLVGQRSVQVDGRLDVAQLVVGSVRFYAEKGNKRHCCLCGYPQ